jgi:broad specificity phosphatase PhoE
MELILIRHAQANWEAGGPDPSLTDLGKKQVEHLVKNCATWRGATEVLVSPTLRTQETAAPLSEELKLKATVAPWLEEFRFGEGAPKGQLGLPDPATFKSHTVRIMSGLGRFLATKGVTPAPPGLWRVSGKTEHRIVVVGHGGTNAVALECLLGIEPVPWSWFRFGFVHTAVTRLKTFPVKETYTFSLVRHGDTTHLPKELRTY